MKYKTLKELMSAVRCEKYPQCWGNYFEQAMSDFEKNGCPLAKEEYYDELNKKYGILNTYGEFYRQAASELAQNQPLSALAVLLCHVLRDRTDWRKCLDGFEMPKPKEGEGSLVYDLFGALILTSLADISHENMIKRNIPKDIARYVMDVPEMVIRDYMVRHEGKPGHDLLGWCQLYIDGELFRIGRLEIQINKKFGIKAKVFRNKKGEIVTLANGAELHKSGFALGSKGFEDEDGSWNADLKETETEWIGYRYTESAYVEKVSTTLKKDEWTVVLSENDYVIDLHIPADGKLTPEMVDETIGEIKVFLKEYYPDYDYKAFTCSSWLLDPQLVELLGEESNISKFCRRFTPMTIKSDGNSVFYFIFKKPDMNFELESLPENTSLERILKKHYLEGKVIYGTAGFFLYDRLKNDGVF